MQTSELIAALEQATGPDRELDAAIGRAMSVTPKSLNVYKRNLYPRRLVGVKEVWPVFTASIDAALTLVPEGWTRDVDATAPEMGIAVTLHGPDKASAVGDHGSEAIATCIAALRAGSGA